MGRQDDNLDQELQALEPIRALYASVPLPDPPDRLSEAILRQEPLLRPAPVHWSAALLRLLLHPGVAATGVVVLALGTGVFVTSRQVPSVASEQTVADGPAELGVDHRGGAIGDELAAPAAEEPAQVPPAELRDAPDTAAARGFEALAKGTARPAKDRAPARRSKESARRAEESTRRAEDKGEAAAGERQRRQAPSSSVDGDELEQRLLRAALPAAPPPAATPGSGGQLEGWVRPSKPSAPAAATDDAYAYAGAGGNVAPAAEPAPETKAGLEVETETLSDLKEDAEMAQKRKSAASQVPHSVAGAGGLGDREFRARSYMDSGMFAYDRRRYVDALGLFQRARDLDRSNELAPAPRVMEARTLLQLKRYREAAAIFEQVLADYPAYRGRPQVARELIACYRVLKDEAAQRAALERYAQDLSPERVDESKANRSAPAVAH